MLLLRYPRQLQSCPPTLFGICSLLHAVRRIPGTLELADVENLPCVIGVVRADVGNGGRYLEPASPPAFSRPRLPDLSSRDPARCTIWSQCAASKSLNVSSLSSGIAASLRADAPAHSRSRRPDDKPAFLPNGSRWNRFCPGAFCGTHFACSAVSPATAVLIGVNHSALSWVLWSSDRKTSAM